MLSKSRLVSLMVGGFVLCIPYNMMQSAIVDVGRQDNIIQTIATDELVEVFDEVYDTNQMTIDRYKIEDVKEEVKEDKKEPSKKYMGKFTITHYCSCRICNGKWTNKPARNGEPLKENYTIAVDPKVIPLNSFVEINGNKYKACDTGSAIKGNKIDIFVDDHNECLKLGKYKTDVYLYE